jgi:hypothetical protein
MERVMATKHWMSHLAIVTWVALLAGCGGSGMPAAAGAFAPQFAALPAQASSTAQRMVALHRPVCRGKCLTGTAAVGAAFANGVVSITDSTGANACQEGSITTSLGGTYTCNLKGAATAPFFVVVTDPTGNFQPVVSVATAAPTGSQPLVVNATPLTTAILTVLSNGDPLALVASGTIDTQALATITSQVVAQLAPVLSSVGADSTYDPFSTPIVAATSSNTGNSADAVLDVVTITTSGANVSLTTAGSTTSVPLGSTQTVPPPSSSTLSLLDAQQAFASQMTQCFALPTSSRVLAADASVPLTSGGPTVTSMASACTAPVSTAANAGVDFMHNGYSFGQLMYTLLNRDSMTGAAVSVPEAVLVIPGSGTTPDRAILNFRFVDNQGNPGNILMAASNLPNAPTPGWWLTGNQEPIDAYPRPAIRRVEELNPAAPASSGDYQSGFTPVINALGPNGIVNGQPMNKVRLSGPGLPMNGLVFVAPTPAEVNQRYMDLNDVNGALTTPGRCGGVIPGNCPLFWMERTVSLADTTTATNPASFFWRQASMTLTPGSPVKGALYTIEVFYGADTTPTFTYQKPLLSGVVPASQGANLQWNSLGPTSAQLLDPTNTTYNGTLSFTVTIDWLQNLLAEQIASATISTDYKGTVATSVQAAPGATSLQFPSVNTPPLGPNNSRLLLFGYRVLDGSAKSAMYKWN